MKREYKLFKNLMLIVKRKSLIEAIKSAYKERFPETKANNTFKYCVAYCLYENSSALPQIKIKFPQDFKLLVEYRHKTPRPIGIENQNIHTIDIREMTNILIPPYQGKYYFDFIFMIFDENRKDYLISGLIREHYCLDNRYYLSKDSKKEYRTISQNTASIYTRLMLFGNEVDINNGEIKVSKELNTLIEHGWLPTLSVLPKPYIDLIRWIRKGYSIIEINHFMVKLFKNNPDLIENFYVRWSQASLVKDRKIILANGLKAYLNNDTVSCIYILLPQIEGLITKHIKRKTGLKLKPMLADRFDQFGKSIKEEKFNSELTSYLTDALVLNLKGSFYKTWYPDKRRNRTYRTKANSPQRNVLLHGEINPSYFSKENCLKLICILDAIILLSLRKHEIACNKEAANYKPLSQL